MTVLICDGRVGVQAGSGFELKNQQESRKPIDWFVRDEVSTVDLSSQGRKQKKGVGRTLIMRASWTNLVLVALCHAAYGFAPGPSCCPRSHKTNLVICAEASKRNGNLGRRDWFLSTIIASFGVNIAGNVQSARADEMAVSSGMDAVAGVLTPAVEMKQFIDPEGFFSIRIPKSYFALRRSDKGDLPDPKTGKGRRGSSIFTAGDMNKAEIVAVER